MFLLSFIALILPGTLAQSGPYYGLPLGSFHYSATGTKGDIYAADPSTLVLVNFHHRGRPGYFHPFDWPFEFGNLRVDETASIFDPNAKQEDPFAGIEIDVGSGEGISFDETTTSSTSTPRPTTKAPVTRTHVPPTPPHPKIQPIAQVLAKQRAAAEIPRPLSTSTSSTIVPKTSPKPQVALKVKDTDPLVPLSRKIMEPVPLKPIDPLEQMAKERQEMVDTYKQSPDPEHPARPTQWEIQQQLYEQWWIDQQTKYAEKFEEFQTTTEPPTTEDNTEGWWYPAWAAEEDEPEGPEGPVESTTPDPRFIPWHQQTEVQDEFVEENFQYPTWAREQQGWNAWEIPSETTTTTTERSVRQVAFEGDRLHQHLRETVHRPPPSQVQRIHPVIQLPPPVPLHPQHSGILPIQRSSEQKPAPAPAPAPFPWTTTPRPTPNPESKFKFVHAPRPPRIDADGQVITTQKPEVQSGIIWGDGFGNLPELPRNREEDRFGFNQRQSRRRRPRPQSPTTPRPPIGHGIHWFDSNDQSGVAPPSEPLKSAWGPLPRKPTIFFKLGPDGRVKSLKQGEFPEDIDQTDYSQFDYQDTNEQRNQDFSSNNNGGFTVLFGQANPATATLPSARQGRFNGNQRRNRPQGPGRGGSSRLNRQRPLGFRTSGPPGNLRTGPPGTDNGFQFQLGSSSADSNEAEFQSFRSGSGRQNTTPDPDGPIPLFYVIEDPHVARSEIGNRAPSTSGARTQSRTSSRRQPEQNSFRRVQPSTLAPWWIDSPPGTPPPYPPARHGEYFALQESNGESMMIHLQPDYKLTDFRWVGVYDHCQKRRTAFVSLQDVQPPKETAIDGLQGWQYNTGSESIVVMNCNTLLLKKFNYDGGNSTEAYIYVGTGDFPRNIVQQVKAYVVGRIAKQPLPNYKDEDVMVRLPPGWKTFDVNFISVYSPKTRVSYAHSTIPPLVVPPCEDLYL